VSKDTGKSKARSRKMGTIIFLMAVIVEAAFAAFCIITKSNHVKERSIIRIASFWNLGFTFFI
jgi:hypothetical protein